MGANGGGISHEPWCVIASPRQISGSRRRVYPGVDAEAWRPSNPYEHTTAAQYHEVAELDNPGAELVNRRYFICDILKKETNLFCDNNMIRSSEEKKSKNVNSYQR